MGIQRQFIFEVGIIDAATVSFTVKGWRRGRRSGAQLPMTCPPRSEAATANAYDLIFIFIVGIIRGSSDYDVCLTDWK